MVSYTRCSHYGTRDAQIAIYVCKIRQNQAYKQEIELVAYLSGSPCICFAKLCCGESIVKNRMSA